MKRPKLKEVVFDDGVATCIFPKPLPKNAVLVQVPTAKDGSELPTFMEPEWGGVQLFLGAHYLVVVDGVAMYGSAKDQWELMHTQISPGYWVKTGVPSAYVATEPCRVTTFIPSDNGEIRETTFAFYTLEAGDWIVRQPGGEVQHIQADKFPDLYFSQEEAAALGLDRMTGVQFTTWAVSRVRYTFTAPQPW